MKRIGRMNDLDRKKRLLRKQGRRLAVSFTVTALLTVLLFSLHASAAGPQISIDLNAGEGGNGLGTLELLLLFTVIALAPSILIMMTSFTRIIIVLSFLRNALGTQQSPPNQVLVGLALFLTLFIMMPVFSEINEQAYTPYASGEISMDEAVERAVVPLKQFMLKQVYTKDLNLFLDVSGDAGAMERVVESDTPTGELMSLGMEVVIPAFITSELKRAFLIGFLLFLPFLVIDMVVSSALMSMGMVMLPPSMISLPFKIMVFVVVDGWNLLFDMLISGFR